MSNKTTFSKELILKINSGVATLNISTNFGIAYSKVYLFIHVFNVATPELTKALTVYGRIFNFQGTNRSIL